MISIKILRYIFGALYVMAGVAKAFPQIEDVGKVLQKAASANHDTWFAGLSQWLAGHALLMAWVSGIALLLSGLCYLFNRLLLPAVIGQCLMLAGFVTILERAFPQIVLIDLIFLVVALLVLWESVKRKKNYTRSPPILRSRGRKSSVAETSRISAGRNNFK